MAQAQKGDTVNVQYTGKLDDGTVFDTSENREPLRFEIGGGQIIPDFEEAVVGMAPGERKTIQIPAEKAYGPHRDDMVVSVPRDQVPGDIELEVGEHLQVSQPDGGTAIVTVADVSEEAVILDANHPLAGEDLTFDIELVEIA